MFLLQETYHSDTSDDEDWADTATPSRKKKLTTKIIPGSPNGNASNNSRRTAKRNTHQHKVENTNNSPTKTLEGCTESGKKRGSSYNKLGEAVVQVIVKFCSGYLSTKFLICILIFPFGLWFNLCPLSILKYLYAKLNCRSDFFGGRGFIFLFL